MKKLIYLLLLLLLSIGLNVYFLMGEGIRIFNDNRIYNHAHQNQQQAQLIISLFASQGQLSWETYSLKDLENKGFNQECFTDRVNAFLNSLAPEQSLMAKIVAPQYMSDLVVYVPKITEEK